LNPEENKTSSWLFFLLFKGAKGRVASIFEYPGPALKILSFGSLVGSFFQGLYEAILILSFSKFFSQDPQDHPPNGFLASIASSPSGFMISFSNLISSFSTYLKPLSISNFFRKFFVEVFHKFLLNNFLIGLLRLSAGFQGSNCWIFLEFL
jgi:hypothetical protein